MATRHALLVEHDHATLALIEPILRARAFGVQVATNETDALASFGRGADVVLVGDPLGSADGVSIIRRLRALDPFCPMMLMAGEARVEHAVEALQIGVTDYTRKPIQPAALERFLEAVVDARDPSACSPRSAIDGLAGDSAPIRRLRASLKRVIRRARAPILLTGETGTGKTLVARAVHADDAAATGSLRTVACGALSASAIELALFGCSGRRAPGLLEHARRGTLLIEDIDQLPLSLQAKLVAKLDAGCFRGAKDIDEPLDLRVVATTRTDLREAVRHERFRADLYYRLAVFTADLPPLRERPSDIELLARRFIIEIGHRDLRTPPLLTEGALQRLAAHTWPGNVRELRSVVERSMLSERGSRLGPESLDFPEAPVSRAELLDLPADGVDLRAFEQRMVEQALQRAGGNLTRAAALLGLNRDQVRYRIAKYGLQR